MTVKKWAVISPIRDSTAVHSFSRTEQYQLEPGLAFLRHDQILRYEIHLMLICRDVADRSSQKVGDALICKILYR